MIEGLFPDGVVAVAARESMWSGALPPAEAEVIAEAVPKRRREFTAGRLCAREALAKLGSETFPLLADADRVPVWPPGVVGSISHTRQHCAAVVAKRSRYAGLGLDLERPGGLASDVAGRIASPSEIEWMAALPPLEGSDWPKLLFSAKESTYKCYFPLARTRLGFRDVEVEFSADGVFTATLLRADAPTAAGARRFDGRYRCEPGFVATAVWLGA